MVFKVLLNVIEDAAKSRLWAPVSFNTKLLAWLLVHMVRKYSLLCILLLCVKLANYELKYASQFEYLGHIMEQSFYDSDINTPRVKKHVTELLFIYSPNIDRF